MVILKSDSEIALMREAGRIVAECHALIAERIKPGVTTLALDEMVEAHIRSHGAVPSFKGHHGFPGSICVARNEVICHGFPDATPLKEGDVVTLDTGAFYQGYHGDSAWTYAIGKVSNEIAGLMEVCHHSLMLGIENAKIGNRIGDIGSSIQAYAEGYNYGVVREFIGHGIGKDLWEEPPVPHYGPRGSGITIEKGLVLAIEPMLTLGDWRSHLESDGWTARTKDRSICVQYEHTIAITENGPEILTKL